MAGSFVELSTALLRTGVPVRFSAPGRSMQPTIREGEVIVVEPVAPAAVRRGDIVLYRGAHGVIAHRVVAIASAIPRSRPDDGRRTFVARGDAAEGCDAPLPLARILGRVTAVERNGRRVRLTAPGARLARRARGAISRLRRRIDRALR